MLRFVVRRLLLLVPILLGLSILIFFLGLVLKYVFAVRLGWLPSVGRIDVERDVHHPTNFYVLDAVVTGDWHTLVDVLRHLLLPAIALGTIPLAIVRSEEHTSE